ncbi:GM21602 [Drosophila sechellia]|uniref:GM21602 n=1 Tax=Drosophila sechellia TaxID=7238 RepID=B4HS26_DROSE|nr:GM21602 [Drosophila sechellia]
MSDEEEDSVSEGFSASEDEWKPSKDVKGGESSDDDDSDFDELQAEGGAAGSSGRSSAVAGKRGSDHKPPSGIKGSSVKKRKPTGQSLRSKLYNKYRPPPKTFPTSPSQQQENTPRASGSKNAKTPNESGARNQHDPADSSSESSVEDYLVNPADLDLHSTFFAGGQKEKSPAPQFDCNAGITNLSDSGSEDNNESSFEDKAGNAFDFRGLLENANSLERTRDALSKRNVTATPPRSQAATMDVNALLALGENQNYQSVEVEEREGNQRKKAGRGAPAAPPTLDEPSRLSKTKSTRIKRHTKTRPVSTVVANAGDTDDSDFEEVADADLSSDQDDGETPNISGDLEIRVGLEGLRPTKEQKTQHELEMALKRRLNRDIKDRQILLHKVSLMCQIARSLKYNRLLSESDALMQATLKLLPSRNAYPTERGTELKYLQSFVTWFKTSIKLLSPNLYSAQSPATKEAILEALLEQVKRKEARCKQDMIFIFIALARGMGMHCRLIVNLQPMPLRPAASDLIPIKLRPDDKNKSQTVESEGESEDEKTKKDKKARKPADSKHEKESSDSKKSKMAPVDTFSPVAGRTRRAAVKPKTEEKPQVVGSPVIPKLMLSKVKQLNAKHSDTENASPVDKHLQEQRNTRETRSRSKSPKVLISPSFLKKKPHGADSTSAPQKHQMAPKSKARISPNFLSEALPARQLRSRGQKASSLAIPQLDGGDDVPLPRKRPRLEKLKNSQDSDEVFEPAKPVKKAPVLPKSVQNLRKDRRVMSTDDEGGSRLNRKTDASDMWVEVWSDVEEQWICVDLFKGKLHCVDTIRKNATPGLAYVFAFQDDQSLKDVTARYCASWSTTVRKARVEKVWLDETIAPYLGHRTKRDITEDDQLRRIHSDKPLPKSISDFKDHPLYVLERHLLKFQGLYPPDAPTLGFIRGEAVYSRDCVHLLHSREIWLKSARVVKLGEQPYKVVKARPKWDKLTRTVIKDQPLEIFGYWQTQEYEPPTAENGIVPRNAYGNVELFKDCMLPKKTVHLRLPGLIRICKKLNIDCANAVVGFDFHQGACHPMYDGFIVCEEFREVVTAAWEEDQQVQVLKEQEKYETRVYGNWKKLIKGLLIRERLKKKYNF